MASSVLTGVAAGLTQDGLVVETDVDAVIQRTLAYQEAGADGICLVGVRDFAHLEASLGDALTTTPLDEMERLWRQAADAEPGRPPAPSQD